MSSHFQVHYSVFARVQIKSENIFLSERDQNLQGQNIKTKKSIS